MAGRPGSTDLSGRSLLRGLAPWALAGALAAIAMALLDPVRPTALGAYLAILPPGSIALWAAWRWVAGDGQPRGLPAATAGNGGPRWLPYAVGAAVLLRLGVGVLFVRGLPEHGYNDLEAHQAGYYYLDAWLRDEDARELALTTSRPLTDALVERSGSDQYGGLLFISAAVYRILSPQAHHPLLIVSLAAITSGLAVVFAWGFVAGVFGRTEAALVGWGVALVPEAVLLGASQMREPYLIAGLSATLYGLSLVRRGQQGGGLTVALVALLLTALISPPYALIFATLLAGALLWERRGARLRLLIVAAAIAVLGLVLTAGAWGQIEQAPQGDLLGLLDWWLTGGARFELVRLERGSGFVQKLFESSPEWAHLPMATGYGLVQPFLPATLLDSTSLPLPRALGVFRGVGWFVLLPFLLYAPLAAARSAGWRSLATYLSALVWLTAILASYRLAGDLWNNPRSRAVFLPIQLAVVGWAWVHARRSNSPWLARTAWLVGGSTLIFLQWYAGRYYQTPQLNLNQTVLAVAVYSIGLLGGALLWDRSRRNRGLTAPAPKV